MWNSTVAVKHVIFASSLVNTSAMTEYFPGGICLGSSTSFASDVTLSFFSGHSRSTWPTFSHRSAVWRIIVIRPYLTVRRTLAPSSTSSDSLPLAVMVRGSPLQIGTSVLVLWGVLQALVKRGEHTLSADWEKDRRSLD